MQAFLGLRTHFFLGPKARCNSVPDFRYNTGPRMKTFVETIAFAAVCLAAAVRPAAASLGDMGSIFDGGADADKVWGEILDTQVDGSDWVLKDPEDSVSDDNPSAPDKHDFWERLEARAFESLCKNLRLQVKQKLQGGEFAETAIRVKRRLRRMPQGNLAIVDESSIELSLGISRQLADFADESLGVSIFAGSRLEGMSYVVRPIEGEKSCKELDRLINPFDLKTVLPLSGKRFSKMDVGELWKIPLTMELRVGVGVGGRIVEELPISISFGRSRQGSASVTLYRVSPEVLRFRFRLDQARIKSKGASATVYVSAVELGLPVGENILTKFVSRAVAKQINRYLSAQFNISKHNRKGRQAVIEFLLDPRDAEQMTALAKVLKGDLNILDALRRMVYTRNGMLAEREKARQEVLKLEGGHEQALGLDATFAGLSEYDRTSRPFRFVIPILFDYESSKDKSTDHYILLDDSGEEFDIHRAGKRSGYGFFDIPFLGQMTKHETQQRAEVFTRKDKDGKISDPVAIYIRQEGFLRESASSSRSIARRIDAITGLTGTGGEGRNERTSLPIEELFPKYPKKKHDPRRRRRSGGPQNTHRGNSTPNYRRGMMSLTVAFHQKAIQDILHASPREVIAAYTHTLTGETREMMEAALKHGTIQKDGKIEYKRRKISKETGIDPFGSSAGNNNPYWDLRRAAKKATKIVQDLAAAAQAADPEKQAEAFLNVLAGESKSGLAFDEIVKILIQLVDPTDITAEFYVQVVKKIKGEEDINARYVLHEGGESELLDSMIRAKARFAPPTTLRD